MVTTSGFSIHINRRCFQAGVFYYWPSLELLELSENKKQCLIVGSIIIFKFSTHIIPQFCPHWHVQIPQPPLKGCRKTVVNRRRKRNDEEECNRCVWPFSTFMKIFANCLVFTLGIWFSIYAKVIHCLSLRMRDYWGCLSNWAMVLLSSPGVTLVPFIPLGLNVGPWWLPAIGSYFSCLWSMGLFILLLSPVKVLCYLLHFIYHYSVFTVKVGPELGLRASISIFYWHVHMHPHL